MPDLTVVCAASGKAWVRRARRALDSVLALAPDVKTILYPYKRRQGRGDADRLQGILQADTPWVLSIDADVLAAGDVRAPVLHNRHWGMYAVLAREAPIRRHPAWHQDRWEAMLKAAGLDPCPVAWNGAFYIERRVAGEIIPRLGHWTRFYLDRRPAVFERPHRKPGQIAFTLALAEAGLFLGSVGWVEAETFSFHGERPIGQIGPIGPMGQTTQPTAHERPGIIHHIGGKRYVELEAAGKLESALEERRP